MWVYQYDFKTGEEVDVNKGHHGPVHNVRFSPTHDSYASGSEDGTIRVWYLDGSAPAVEGAANGNGAAAS
jgi:serine-threonine kinase receptor-associated protein